MYKRFPLNIWIFLKLGNNCGKRLLYLVPKIHLTTGWIDWHKMLNLLLSASLLDKEYNPNC